MTQPHPPDNDGIVDFTIPMEPIRFRVGPDDDDVFAAPAMIAPVTLQRVVAARAEFSTAMQAATGSGEEAAVVTALNKIGRMFEILLPGSEGKRFTGRLFDEERPLDLTRQVLPIMHLLLERYGLRPTTPSSDSPNGSPTRTGDTPSTDGASAEASTNTT